MKKAKPVFNDLGLSKNESAALTFKADLYIKIIDVIKIQKLSARDLEKILDVPQPRVSELLNGKLSSVSVEKLINYLEKLGIIASASFKQQRVS